MSATGHRFSRVRPLTVGADVGATWIRVRASRGGRTMRFRARAPEAGGLCKFLRSAWRRRGWAASEVEALVVASRGVWTAPERRALASGLRALARRVVAVSDAQMALLGALGTEPGVLILAGTGSIVVGRNARGQWARAGGLGPLLGDEGSAFWLGREWLRATTLGEDFGPVRRLVTSVNPVGRIAALAPNVVRRARRGDRPARAIVRAGQALLAEQALAVARQLRLPPPVALTWAGSVLDNPWFRAGLRRAVARGGLRARWRAPALEPVAAAALLARRIAAGQFDGL